MAIPRVSKALQPLRIGLLLFLLAALSTVAAPAAPKAKALVPVTAYALVQVCGVSGNGHCDKIVYKMPAELTKEGCDAMGGLYRGRIIGADDDTGEPGRVQVWECFTSRLPVKNAKPLLD